MVHGFSLSTGINNLKLFLYLRNTKRVGLRLQLVVVSCLRKATCTENFLELKIAGWMKIFNAVNWEFISASDYFAGLFLSVWGIFCFPWRWVFGHKTNRRGATNPAQKPCDRSSSSSVFIYQSPWVQWVSSSRYASINNKDHWLKQQLMRLTSVISQGYMDLVFWQ